LKQLTEKEENVQFEDKDFFGKFPFSTQRHEVFQLCIGRVLNEKEVGTFEPTSSQKENIFLIHVFL
jgi:hypothetical protein